MTQPSPTELHTGIFGWDANRASTSFFYFIIVLSDKNFHNSEFKDTREMKIICMAHYFIKFS